jgi:glycosyltransferase involved in cell wall biosynthesis
MWSVVIPTFNRAPILAKCLNALESQIPGIEFEVVVVDDGSTDSTGDFLASWAGRRFFLNRLRQSNQKPAAARNLGLARCRGSHILFIGDDIIAAQDLLAEHADAHNRQAEPVAVLGHTLWSSELRITRFMRYLAEQGWQFGYGLIENPDDLPFNFFYTSNVSLPVDLQRSVGLFDESFGTAGWEDTEYGYRLKLQGGRIVYREQARAQHLHVTSFQSFCSRQYRVGRFAPYFFGKHPELRPALGADTPLPSLPRRIALEALTRLCGVEDRFQALNLSRFYSDLMTYHYLRGLHSASGGET